MQTNGRESKNTYMIKQRSIKQRSDRERRPDIQNPLSLGKLEEREIVLQVYSVRLSITPQLLRTLPLQMVI